MQSEYGSVAAAGLAEHGGNLEEVASRLAVDPALLTDLSANVNPLGPPASVLAALRYAVADVAALQRYPEPTYRDLRERLASEHGIDREAIVVGNGGAALIETALGDPSVTRCVLPTPAFSENERALRALGIEAVAVPLDVSVDFRLDPDDVVRQVKASGAQVALLTNPHNPSGVLFPRAQMTVLIERLVSAGCRTIVDEAFMDYAPSESVSDIAVGSDWVTCIRSLTKFYSIPALRVGYLLCSPHRAASYRERLASWPVTTLAAIAAAAAFDDPEFAAHTRAINSAERAWLRLQLQGLACRVPFSSANFLLVKLPVHGESPKVTERLARDFRIVVRDCSSYAGLDDGQWIRVAIRTRVESARLVSGLATILTG